MKEPRSEGGEMKDCKKIWECDKCPVCLAHTHHLTEHKCDRLMALLYEKSKKKKAAK